MEKEKQPELQSVVHGKSPEAVFEILEDLGFWGQQDEPAAEALPSVLGQIEKESQNGYVMRPHEYKLFDVLADALQKAGYGQFGQQQAAEFKSALLEAAKDYDKRHRPRNPER